jgi:hypothetical protein
MALHGELGAASGQHGQGLGGRHDAELLWPGLLIQGVYGARGVGGPIAVWQMATRGGLHPRITPCFQCVH